MHTVQHVFPCIAEIRDGIVAAVAAGQEQDSPAAAASAAAAVSAQTAAEPALDVLHVLENDGAALSLPAFTTSPPDEAADLGFLVTDDYLNGVYDWRDH